MGCIGASPLGCLGWAWEYLGLSGAGTCYWSGILGLLGNFYQTDQIDLKNTRKTSLGGKPVASDLGEFK